MEDSELVVVEEMPPTKPDSSSSGSSSSSVIWAKVKPFANGGVTAVVAMSQTYLLLHVAESAGGPQVAAKIKADLLQSNPAFKFFLKRFPVWLLFQATYSSARFGSFEILTKRLETTNDGRPLTLYQEACCGLTAGAIGAYIGFPIRSVLWADANQLAANQLNYRNVFHVLYHTIANKGVLAMWKGAGHYVNGSMAINMGMLASYNRSCNYFNESLGFSELRSQLGAGVVSGFFASACSYPYLNVRRIMVSTQPDANGKFPFTSFLDCALKTLKFGGPSIFYKGFLKYFAKTTPPIMMTWMLLEEIRKVEESMGL